MLQEIKRFIEGLEELPAVSPVGLKLISLASHQEVGLREVSDILRADQSLASKILRLANSPAFGFSGRVTSIDRACTLLGLDLVRSAALSVIVVDIFCDQDDGHMPLDEFWRHSMTCALASEALAERLGHKDKKEAFLAGLLHDIGKLVLLKWNRQKYDAVLAEALECEEPLLAVEERLLGAGHTWVAKTLMEHWHFPDAIRNAAWLHHQPANHFGEDAHLHTAFIVGCADSLCHHFRFGSSGNAVTLFDLEDLSARTQLSVRELVDISSDVLRNYDQVASEFDWQGGDSAQLYMTALTRANRELTRIHMDLQTRNSELLRRQQVMESVQMLQETVNPPSSSLAALETAVELLKKVMRTRRLAALAPQPDHPGFQGWLLSHEAKSPQPLCFDLTKADAGQDVTRLPQRQQVALIIRGLEAMEEDSGAAQELRAALRSPDLLVVPLMSGQRILGQVFADLDLQSEREGQAEATAMLQQFAHSMAICLERIIMFEEIDRQAERLARLSRQQESVRIKLSQSERLASVGRLAAGAAHEINNPLTIISAQTQLLRSQGPSEKQQKALDNILLQSERIAKIVRDLMGLARPARPQAKPVAVKEVLEQTLQSLQERLEKSGVDVESDFQKVEPVRADPLQLEQVFVNLTVNAIQAMEQGGRLTVRLRPDRKNKGVRIDFVDTGHGIADDHLQSIFDPFFSTKNEGQGVGLGLAICHSIVQAHNGELQVASKVGEGTTFTIRLPLNGVASRSSSPAEGKTANLRPIWGKRGRVLVVDREATLGRILSEALRTHGFRADTASDSEQAQQMADETDYAAAVVDIRLTGSCDPQLIKALHEIRPEMKILATSGSTDEREFKSVRSLTAARLRKPFPPDRLVEVLHKALCYKKTTPVPFPERHASA